MQQANASDNLLVLGTAQDGGYPHTGCSEDCCREAWKDSNQKRLIASLAVLDGKDCFLVDITPDFKYQLQLIEHHINEKPRISGICITHAHLGHYMGLLELGLEVMNTDAIPVYVMPKMKSFLENNAPFTQLLELNNIRLFVLQDNCPIDIFGVGSNYGVSADLPVMEGVYKLVETEGRPVSKNSLGKQYFPYSKQVYRYYENNRFDHDIVTKQDNILDNGIALIDQVFDKGDLMYSKLPIDEIRTYIANQFRSLPEEYKDLNSAETFSVKIKI